MSTTKRQHASCPVCDSAIESFDIHFDSIMTLCVNPKCVYPFNQPLDLFLQFIRKSDVKRLKYQNKTKPLRAEGCRQNASVVENERLETTPLKARLNTKLQKNKKLTKDIDEIPCALDSKDTLFSIPPIMTADEPSVETSGFQNVPNMGGSGLDTASDLSLADIEHLLCDQEILNERETPYPSVVTPKDSEDLGWMTSLNDVLNFGTTDSKYNPLMGNQELDVLLGL